MSGSASKPRVARLNIVQFQTPTITLAVLLVLLFFTGLAVYHLADVSSPGWFARVCAVIWLLLVFFVAGCGVCVCVRGFVFGDQAVRRDIISAPGRVSFWHFVEVATVDGQPQTIEVGHRLIGCRSYYARFDVTALFSVTWSQGRASGRAGGDMRDWQIWIRYRSMREDGRLGPRILQPIGTCGSRFRIDRIGRRLIALLLAAGVPLQQTESNRWGCQFSFTGSDTSAHTGQAAGPS